MNENNYSIANLHTNLTKKQIAGFITLIIIVGLIIWGVISIANTITQGNSATETEQAIDPNIPTSAGSKWGEDERDSNNTEDITVPVQTTYREDHEYTLNDYLPTARYAYLNYGENSTVMRDYWWIMENTAIQNGIVISANSCDEAKYTNEAKAYLRSLPIDLSDYVIVYQTHTDEAPCNL